MLLSGQEHRAFNLETYQWIKEQPRVAQHWYESWRDQKQISALYEIINESNVESAREAEAAAKSSEESLLKSRALDKAQQSTIDSLTKENKQLKKIGLVGLGVAFAIGTLVN